jgi:hypothetical protein
MMCERNVERMDTFPWVLHTACEGWTVSRRHVLSTVPMPLGHVHQDKTKT